MDNADIIEEIRLKKGQVCPYCFESLPQIKEEYERWEETRKRQKAMEL